MKPSASFCKSINGFIVKHEVIEVCGTFNSNSYHFIFERDARGGGLNLWNSKVNIHYIGKSNNCDLNTDDWANKKGGTFLDQDGMLSSQLILMSESKVNNYSMNKFLNENENFLKRYPKYNLLYNCQHYAINLYNKLTNGHLGFEDQDILGNIEKLLFNVD